MMMGTRAAPESLLRAVEFISVAIFVVLHPTVGSSGTWMIPSLVNKNIKRPTSKRIQRHNTQAKLTISSLSTCAHLKKNLLVLNRFLSVGRHPMFEGLRGVLASRKLQKKMRKLLGETKNEFWHVLCETGFLRKFNYNKALINTQVICSDLL